LLRFSLRYGGDSVSGLLASCLLIKGCARISPPKAWWIGWAVFGGAFAAGTAAGIMRRRRRLTKWDKEQRPAGST
jgi:hypothetical protein